MARFFKIPIDFRFEFEVIEIDVNDLQSWKSLMIVTLFGISREVIDELEKQSFPICSKFGGNIMDWRDKQFENNDSVNIMRLLQWLKSTVSTEVSEKQKDCKSVSCEFCSKYTDWIVDLHSKNAEFPVLPAWIRWTLEGTVNVLVPDGNLIRTCLSSESYWTPWLIYWTLVFIFWWFLFFEVLSLFVVFIENTLLSYTTGTSNWIHL